MYKEGDAFVIKNIIINKYLDIQFLQRFKQLLIRLAMTVPLHCKCLTIKRIETNRA